MFIGSDLMDATKIKKELIRQKKCKFKGNIYHFSQVSFAYNSNKIEGSRLTEDQTEAIFDTQSFIPKSEDLIKLDDLIEVKNYFKLFDYILDNIDVVLTKNMILKMHKMLKRGTTDEDNPLYNVGGFKKVPNIIGLQNVNETSSPENVQNDLEKLLIDYKKLQEVTLKDIIDFHVRFERIHPLSDGNGRIGRLIMFKECLKNNIVPFIILNVEKAFYMRGLKEYSKDRKYLKDTILHFQDMYDEMCNKLLDYDI